MVSETLEKELHDQLEHLAPNQQRQVLEFARTLSTTRVQGSPGRSLLAFAGAIPADDLSIMSRTIEADK